MKGRIVFMLALVAGAFHSQAQYLISGGVRIGGTSGATAKYFYKPDIALEGIAGTFGNGYSATGLVEKYIPALETKGLSFFYGGGLHLAVYNGRDIYASRFGRELDYHRHNTFGFGFNVIGGIEYQIDAIPLCFTLDLKPFVEVGSGGFVGVAPDPSIGIRYIFKYRE